MGEVSRELVKRLDAGGALRIGIAGHGDDWLGPGVRAGGGEDGWLLAVTDDGLVLGSEPARRGVSTGCFTDLLLGWRFAPSERTASGIPEGTRAIGFQVAEFAFPTPTDASMADWFVLPHRPSALSLLLLVAPDRTTMLVGPGTNPHAVTIPIGDGHVGIGLHGDLDELPAGFETCVAVLAAGSPGEAIDRWADQRWQSPSRPGRYADALGSRLSYWTDNGAAYWYRTEPGHTVASGVAATVDDLVARGVPIGSVQVDSWWYPHEVLRPFDTDEWVVPPTGMLRWEPRPDILPDGLGPLREAVGDLPLVAHTRHLSASSSYLDEFPCWVDGEQAHPSTPALYEHLLDRCVEEGIEIFEHDWLVECFTGIRQLRADPMRAGDWLTAIDAAAAARGRTVQFCMATLADMVEAAALDTVTSVRTSGDSGYLVGPGFLWAWFLMVNRLARPLGLHPFADVFFSGAPEGTVDAVLSLLSTGPVGIGDALGKADPSVLRPCHRADGLLVKPDVPIAATDDIWHAWPFGRARPLVGETWSDKAAGRWRYVFAVNPDDRGPSTVDVSVPVSAGCAVWDWRSRSVVSSMDATLDAHDWRLWVEAPIADGVACFGDPDLYATAGDLRIGDVSPTGDVTVIGSPGEPVEVACWSVSRGVWFEPVEVPASGSVTVQP